MGIVRTEREQKTVNFVVSRLEPHFYIYQEVRGTHCFTGSRKRIDAVIVPKDRLLSRDFPKIPVGLEFKSFNLEDGNKKQVVLLGKQAVDYRYTRFKMRSGEHFLPLILIYPPARAYLEYSNGDRTEFNDGFCYSISRLLGQWFVGELILPTNHDGFEVWISGGRYYRWKQGEGRRLNLNWGFEKYEQVKEELREKELSPSEYQTELLKHVDLLGI